MKCRLPKWSSDHPMNHAHASHLIRSGLDADPAEVGAVAPDPAVVQPWPRHTYINIDIYYPT